MQKSSSELDREKTELEKQLKEAIKQRAIVENATQLLARDILILRTKKKDSDIISSKARSNIKLLEIDIALKTSEFWAAKHEGI